MDSEVSRMLEAMWLGTAPMAIASVSGNKSGIGASNASHARHSRFASPRRSLNEKLLQNWNLLGQIALLVHDLTYSLSGTLKFRSFVERREGSFKGGRGCD